MQLKPVSVAVSFLMDGSAAAGQKTLRDGSAQERGASPEQAAWYHHKPAGVVGLQTSETGLLGASASPDSPQCPTLSSCHLLRA